MVADWLEMLRAEDPDHDLNTSEQGNWATAARLGIKGFDAADPAASYSQVFARTYRGRGGEGFDYLESEVAGRVPSFGYSVLAQILADTRHKTVVTTNFDDLVAEALGTYTTATPVICGHESLAGFIRHHPVRPQIVKVRQHLFYAPNSTAKKLKTLPPGFASALRKLFREHVPVVIGYGGNDGRLMKVLTDEHLDLPQSMYWCYLRSAGRPRQDILDLVARCGGWLVPIDGFDELMIELQDTLELGILDEFLSTRGNERAARYTAQRAAIILARSMRGDAGLRHDESAPLEATRTEGIEATATKAPARQAAKPPARQATKPPAPRATRDSLLCEWCTRQQQNPCAHHSSGTAWHEARPMKTDAPRSMRKACARCLRAQRWRRWPRSFWRDRIQPSTGRRISIFEPSRSARQTAQSLQTTPTF